MLKRPYVAPLVLSAGHTLLVVCFWVVNTKGEVGAAWEGVFGVIDFAVYFTVGVPSFVSAVGVRLSGSWAYALWFAASGAVQWFAIGVGMYLLLSRFLRKHRIREY